MLLEESGYTYAHDPVIVKEGSVYWRLCTGAGITVSASSNLCHWELKGKALKTAPEWTQKAVPREKERSIDFWAPEVVRRGGEWRMYYSVSAFGKRTSAIGMASCLSIAEGVEKGFEDRGIVISSKEGDEKTRRGGYTYNCIDPAVFVDEDGKDNLLFGSFWDGLFILPLDESGKVIEGAKPRLAASRRTVPNAIEGGYVYRHDKMYYLFASHDYCCRGCDSSYHIVVGRSERALGPYYDMDGVPMTEGGGTTIMDGERYERWAGTGHNSVFFDTDGAEYLVFHAYDRQDKGRSKGLISRIDWDNGWPVFIG